jgi:hypothetical protein
LIFKQIVATLRSAKEKRQFIIAAHNANIPVSGDAELILVMQADDRQGWIDAGGAGSIDTDSIKQSVSNSSKGKHFYCKCFPLLLLSRPPSPVFHLVPSHAKARIETVGVHAMRPAIQTSPCNPRQKSVGGSLR